MTIKLLNKGQRTIKYGDKPHQVFAPGKAVVFSEDTAATLKKLFKGEVVDINDIEASYEDGGVADEEKAKPATLTIPKKDTK